MEPAQFAQVGVLAPNPATKRAQRVKWCLKPQPEGSQEKIVAFGAQKSLVLKDLINPKNSKLYGLLVEGNVTSVQYSPNGNYIAFGDDKGAFKVIGWSAAENDFIVKYENSSLFGGAILDIAWADDNQKVVAVGAGNGRAAAINIQTKGKCGDITGHSADLLTVDIRATKPHKVIVSGQDFEVQVYKGVPFKPEKSIQKVHASFINKCAFTKSDDGAHFITVSSDKAVRVHDSESYECVVEKEGAHAQGITDFTLTSNADEFVTCSSDRTARIHRIDYENKAIQQINELILSDFDTAGLKENVEKQQLGVLFDRLDSELMAVGMTSDINVWPLADNSSKPVRTIRGHANAVKALTVFNGSVVVSGDNDGRLLSWDTATAQANRPIGLYKHKIGITALASNSKFVYSASGDMAMMCYEVIEAPESQAGPSLTSVLPDFIKRQASAEDMIATDEFVYVLYLDKSIHMLKADNIAEVVKDSGKLDSLGEAKGEVSCFALSPSRNELVIGDTKGFMHVLDASTLALKGSPPIKSVYGHPVTSVAASHDGKLLAAGDAKGYVTIYDAETHEQKSYLALHKNKVLQMRFTDDNEWVCCRSFDQSMSLGLISNADGSRVLARPNVHGSTTCFRMMQDPANNQSLILAAGTDAAIRMWSY